MTETNTPNLPEPTIFVNIAAFCDENLRFTLESLFSRALRPERIRAGVFDQSNIRLNDWLARQAFSEHVRYLHIDPLHSRGACWARSMSGSLYDGEDYYLQVDSHTWFDAGWDQTLIEHIARLEQHSAKPLLSTYPAPFEFDAHGQPFKTMTDQGSIFALDIDVDGCRGFEHPTFYFKTQHVKGGRYARGFHVAGGFMFARGSFALEVPYDPDMYFHGEEQNIALRAFTSGWDIFHPQHAEIPLYHLYKRVNEESQGHHWRDDVDQKRPVRWTVRQQRSVERLRQLIFEGTVPAPYGLGRARSLDDYRQLSGIDYLGDDLKDVKWQVVN